MATAAAFTALLVTGVVMSTWQAVRATRAQGAAVLARNAEVGERKSAQVQRDRAVRAEEQANVQRDRALTAEKDAKAAAKTAEEERAIATAVNDFVRNDLLGQVSRSGQVDAGFQPDPDIKVRTLLDRASEKVAERFKDQPRVEAEIRMTIGFAYQQLLSSERLAVNKTTVGQRSNMKATAEKHITRALELFEEVLGENDPRTLAAVYQVAAMYSNFKEYDKAEPYFRRNLEGRRRRLGADSPSLLPAMSNLAFVYGQMGRVEEAVQMYQDALQQARRMSAASPREEQTLMRATAGIMHNLGACYLKLKRYAEAEPLLRAALDTRQRALGNKADGPKSGHNLSVCYYLLGRYAEAEVLKRKSLEVVRSRYGEESPEAAKELDFLISILKKQRKFAELDELLRQKVVAARKQSGDQSIAVVTALTQLANSHLEQQRHADAESLLREVLTIREKLTPDRTGNVRSLLGASLAGQGKHAEAEPLLIASYEGLKARLNPSDNPSQLKGNVADAGERLVQFYEQLDQPAEAARWRKDLDEIRPLIGASVQPTDEEPAVPPVEQPVPDFAGQP
jgi:tetratricopeptide (TPR) repeat protein